MTKTDQDKTDHKATETDQDKPRWIKLSKKNDYNNANLSLSLVVIWSTGLKDLSLEFCFAAVDVSVCYLYLQFYISIAYI